MYNSIMEECTEMLANLFLLILFSWTKMTIMRYFIFVSYAKLYLRKIAVIKNLKLYVQEKYKQRAILRTVCKFWIKKHFKRLKSWKLKKYMNLILLCEVRKKYLLNALTVTLVKIWLGDLCQFIYFTREKNSEIIIWKFILKNKTNIKTTNYISEHEKYLHAHIILNIRASQT